MKWRSSYLIPESVLPLLLKRDLGLAGGAASSSMVQSADWDIMAAMLASLSRRPLSTEGSMDWVIRSVLPLTRSSPYRVGGSSIL